MCQSSRRVRLALPLALALAGLMAALGALAWAAGDDEDAPVREGPVLQDPRDLRVGELVPDLAFTDVDGKAGRFSTVQGPHGLVIAVRTVGCPLSKKYAPRLEALRTKWAAKGIGFLLVNPAEQDDLEEIRDARKRYGLTAPLVKDADRSIARTLGVRTTTEVFVLDRSRTLVYRGAIDDQYGLGYARAAPRDTFLEDALVSVLRGERPAVPATSAPG